MVNTTNTDYAFLAEPVVERGMLNEQGVMNVALSFFDITRSLEDDASEKEVILFRQALPVAKTFCASMSDWSFITETVVYDKVDTVNDDEENGVKVYIPYKNFLYAYRLPFDFLKVRYINGDPRKGFAVKGDRIYCNDLGLALDYISLKFHTIHTDFGYLIAYKCAMEMAQHLDPEGTAMARASAMLQQTFSVLKQRDDMNYRLENPPQDHYIDFDSTYWNTKRGKR